MRKDTLLWTDVLGKDTNIKPAALITSDHLAWLLFRVYIIEVFGVRQTQSIVLPWCKNLRHRYCLISRYCYEIQGSSHYIYIYIYIYITGLDIYIYIYIYIYIKSASENSGCGLFANRIYEEYHINLWECSMNGYCYISFSFQVYITKLTNQTYAV